MAGEARIVGVSDVNEGVILVAEVDGEPVVVCRIAGEFHAIGGVCPHAMGPLEDGSIVDGQIECPWHASRFDLKTGAVTRGPATEATPTYEVAVDGQDVIVMSAPDA